MKTISSWQYFHPGSNTIYLNLNSSSGKILRLAPGQEPCFVYNGLNLHNVLQAGSPSWPPTFEYLQCTEGAENLKELILDNVPAPPAQRMLLACWMISIFTAGLLPERGLLHLLGNSSCGKSKTAERLHQLINGCNSLPAMSMAFAEKWAMRYPLVVLDNLENRNLERKTVNSLLLMSHGAYCHRMHGDSPILKKFEAMTLITGIEAFPSRLPELANRAIPLMLSPCYKQEGYRHDENMHDVARKRNVLLSSIFRMISLEVLPGLEDRGYWVHYLEEKYPGHPRARLNGHLSTMMIILEALLKHIPYGRTMDEALGKLEDNWDAETRRKRATEILAGWMFEWARFDGQISTEEATTK